MNRIALLLPYFGRIGNYFELWLESAKYNKKIDFFVFTDDVITSEFNNSDNLHIIKMEFNEVINRIKKILDFKFVLHKPYKLCDYRPLYGEIFAEFISDYEFWGHCDSDVIFGDLSKYITDEILDNNDRVFENGHLCIYRNVDKINKAVLQKTGHKQITSKDVYTCKYSAHFDESPVLKKYLNLVDARCYSDNNFADISYFKKQFVRIVNGTERETIACFEFNKGKLFGYHLNSVTKKIENKEYSYIHLQKRNMAIKVDDFSHFYIVPNEFKSHVHTSDLNVLRMFIQSDQSYEKEMYQKYRKRQLENLKNGALKFRIKGIFEKK